jgi:aminoglycoside phosphotransferase (APT) family kinase protein
MSNAIDPIDPALERVRQVVDEINEANDLRFVVGDRCRGGLQGGAWILTDPAGQRAVLKWRADDRTARRARLLQAVDRIHATGYPTPPWIAAGITVSGSSYHVQRFVPGAPASPLRANTAALLVDVLERQAGLDPDPGNDWRHYVRWCVEDDTDHGPRAFLRGLGQPGWDLLAGFDRVLALHGHLHPPGGDMVHGDFQSCNVLLQDGQVSGVIDIEAFGSGTRAVDYGWLLREAYVTEAGRVAARLIRRAGEAVAGPGVLAMCVAATAFDIVRFQAGHDPESLPRLFARLNHLADDLSRSL